MSKGKIVTEEHRLFIAESPFLLLSSASTDFGADVSPRGDMPGFVKVNDNGDLLLPDRIGNNRLDTLSNIIKNPFLSLSFLIPNNNSVLFIQGTAEISIDPEWLNAFMFKGKPARAVISIKPTFANKQSLNIFDAASIWAHHDHDSIASKIPTLGDILSDQISGVSKEDANKFVSESYAKRLY